ncbi:glycerol-3-phosphate dehydrogenase [Paremcibacter congregatus]|uniref:glycerol-3-phosphate dehydrogenase n=1 Tax=Paremcibacter congregatus TaxID=2043170 RepID=UPI0030ED840D
MTTLEPPYDLLIIGGGINGVGIARDAAGRGLNVLLVEQNDLASGTSSKSTKLIHGGLRYLEQYEFRLVRKALKERELLLGLAPHIIWPMKFILPHAPHLRPKWMIRIGLFFYDHLTRRKKLGKSRAVKLGWDSPLKADFSDAFSYYDCWVDDARLVVLNARDAQDLGATIRPRTIFQSARQQDGLWRARLKDRQTDSLMDVSAKAIVNAAGPWVSDVICDRLALPAHNRLRLVKGSHIILPRLFPGDDAYILQIADGRIIFAIPYEKDFTLVGTTDEAFDGDPGDVQISDAEIDYLCQQINLYFTPTLGHPLSKDDVVSHYAGVRPLYDDATAEASAVTRDYVLALREDGGAPLLSIFGGKITTFRLLAEQAMEKLAPYFPDMAEPWTDSAPLPGGALPDQDRTAFIAAQQDRYPWLDPDLCARYAGLYGTRMDQMFKDYPGRSLKDEGVEDLATEGYLIGPGLYDYEVDFLVRHEWAQTAEDILWRRTKLGLRWSEEDVTRLEKWLKEKQSRTGQHYASLDNRITF